LSVDVSGGVYICKDVSLQDVRFCRDTIHLDIAHTADEEDDKVPDKAHPAYENGEHEA